jgi:hypothetical protein
VNNNDAFFHLKQETALRPFIEMHPIANNATGSSRYPNRRVDLTLLPYTKD